ncbi:hypothetical protein ACUV84_042174 [Puccinellia chinampoensis]
MLAVKLSTALLKSAPRMSTAHISGPTLSSSDEKPPASATISELRQELAMEQLYRVHEHNWVEKLSPAGSRRESLGCPQQDLECGTGGC